MVWTQISLPGIKVSTVLENRVQFLTHILFSNLADVLNKDTDTKDTEFQIDIVNNKGQTSWIMKSTVGLLTWFEPRTFLSWIQTFVWGYSASQGKSTEYNILFTE